MDWGKKTMLMLLFYIGEDRYALETKRVVEVLPMVKLKALHHAPEYIPGLFNYRSHLVPVIDLCHLIRGSPCSSHLSTRIILVNYQGCREPSDRSSQILGLMAERVTDTLNKPETEFVDPGIKLDAAPYLGEMITDEQGMIQCVRVEYLLPESQQINLLPQPKDIVP
jgi:chemotaxis-related protein WspB